MCAGDCCERDRGSAFWEAGPLKTRCRETQRRQIKRLLWEKSPKCGRKEGTPLTSAASESCWETRPLGSVAGVSERLKQYWFAVGAGLFVLGLVVLIVMVFSFPRPPPSPTLPQVTTYLHKDYNNLWIVKKHNVNSGNVAGNWCCLLLPTLSPP